MYVETCVKYHMDCILGPSLMYKYFLWKIFRGWHMYWNLFPIVFSYKCKKNNKYVCVLVRVLNSMIFCSWFFFIVVSLFGNVSDFTNCDSIRMYFSVKRLFLFLKNRFCRIEIDLEEGRTFWSVETWGNLRACMQFKGSFWGKKIKKRRGVRVAKGKGEKEKKILSVTYIIHDQYLLGIWVFIETTD